MPVFAIHNIELGTATDVINLDGRCLEIARLELDVVSLKVLGLSSHPGEMGSQPFDLVYPESHSRFLQCWFDRWERVFFEGDSVVIENARIQYTEHAILTPPGGPKVAATA